MPASLFELNRTQGLKVIEKLIDTSGVSTGTIDLCPNDCTDPECDCTKKIVKLSRYHVDLDLVWEHPFLSLIHSFSGGTCVFKDCEESNELVEAKIQKIAKKYPILFDFPDVDDIEFIKKVNINLAGIETMLQKEENLYFWGNNDRIQDFIAIILFGEEQPNINEIRRSIENEDDGGEDGDDDDSIPLTGDEAYSACNQYFFDIGLDISLEEFVDFVLLSDDNEVVQQNMLLDIIARRDINMLRLLSQVDDDGRGNNVSLLTEKWIAKVAYNNLKPKDGSDTGEDTTTGSLEYDEKYSTTILSDCLSFATYTAFWSKRCERKSAKDVWDFIYEVCENHEPEERSITDIITSNSQADDS